jgi:hypothetical protein
MTVPINYWVVLAAAVVSMVLGFVWYGPLFGRKWARLSGLSSNAMKMKPATFVLLLVGSLLTAYVLAHALIFADTFFRMESDASSGVMVGFMNWLGFVAPLTLGSVLWEGKSWKLWVLNNAYYLVSFCLMGIVLATWM